MTRLVFIDADGTLVGSSGVVLAATWAAAELARNAGLRLALCTGRPGFGPTGDLARRLDPRGWHVFQNGASIRNLETGESRSTPIPDEIVQRVVRRARQRGFVLELYGDAEYAVESDADRARDHATLLGIPFAPRRLESLGHPVVRAQWLATEADAAAHVADREPDLEVIASTSPVMPGTVFINMTKRGVTKATAIETIATVTGVPLADVMFVGDGLNDLAGMRVVGYPVAMGNAEPEVRLVARTVVRHVDEGGLAEALQLALGAG